ncbi:MAG: NADPH-dependent F420 reductase [Calditrichaeota bacterium]|nr:NADPH-dependent F420 reductase [Calditrichota bacterium]MCB9369581.1 NADPH-dependent F420 reductase [Calditrichota bacterium]
MKISIIGMGNVGKALGFRWNEGPHEVMYGVRAPKSDKFVVDQEHKPVRVATIAEAVEWGEVIVLALPYEAAIEMASSCGPCAQKVIIDATNPIAPGLAGLSVSGNTSGAEELQKLQPQAHVVKCFNSTGFNNMSNPVYGKQKSVMFYCGGDAVAKASVRLLTEELGFDAVDAGPLSMARHLESLAMLWIKLAYAEGHGREFAFAMLRR